MDNSFIVEVLKHSSMINVWAGVNIYHLLSQVILQDIKGDVVELGCYSGLTSVLMQKTLDQFKSSKTIHVYDSFEGLPAISKKDGPVYFKKGWFNTSKDALLNNFTKFKVKPPIIHEGFFNETLPKELPKKICFAHLDGDLYSSILESLNAVYPLLEKGAIVVVDDYCDPVVAEKMRYKIVDILPGVKAACDKFFVDKPEEIFVLLAGRKAHAYFKKL